MSTLVGQLRDFVAALKEKEDLRTQMKDPACEDFMAVRRQFLAVDDRCEDLLTAVVLQLNESHARDYLVEALEQLSDSQTQALRRAFEERQLESLLNVVAGDDLPALVRRYRQASAMYTAMQQLNSLRSSCALIPDELDDFLDSPAGNCDEVTWGKAVEKFRAGLAALDDDWADADLDDQQREVSFGLLDRARSEYDDLHEKLAYLVADMLQSGRFDYEVAQIEDPLLRNWLWDFQRVVPQLQAQPQAKAATRAVAVLD